MPSCLLMGRGRNNPRWPVGDDNVCHRHSASHSPTWRMHPHISRTSVVCGSCNSWRKTVHLTQACPTRIESKTTSARRRSRSVFWMYAASFATLTTCSVLSDMLAVSESWLGPLISDAEVSLPGYSIYRSDRSRSCGGIAVYVLDHLTSGTLSAEHFWLVQTPVQLNFDLCHKHPTVLPFLYHLAGTGKTESVKALGNLFGRQVLVFVQL